MEQLLALDGNILLWVQDNLRNPVLSAILKPITHMGDKGIFWILLTLALLLFKKTRKAGLCSMLALFCMLLVNDVMLKHLVNRTRPYEVIEGLTLIVGRASDASFPSGHTASSFASWYALHKSLPMVTDKRKAKGFSILLLVIAILIALSRIYVGIHYPSDVLAGVVVGLLCGVAGYRLGILIMCKRSSS